MTSALLTYPSASPSIHNSFLVYPQINTIHPSGLATSHLSISPHRLTIPQDQLRHPQACQCHQETHPYPYNNRCPVLLPNRMPSRLSSHLLIHLFLTHHLPSLRPHPHLLLLPLVQHHSAPMLVLLFPGRRSQSRILLDRKSISRH